MDTSLKSQKRKHQQYERDIEDLGRSKKKRNASYKHGDEPVNKRNGMSPEATIQTVHCSVKPVSNPSKKVSNLLRALNEVLDESAADDTLDLVGDDVRNKCLHLQKSLQNRPDINFSSTPRSHEEREMATILPAYITPWKASEIPDSFPPLPPILDKTLEEATFSHPGTSNGKFEFINYERLEWLGDAYIEMLTTLLLSKTFQRLSPGRLTELRERLIKNAQLEQYARHYGFDKRLKLGSDPITREAMVKIMGDVFEAYTAAVVLSDPVNGFWTLADWLKDLWGVTLRMEITAEEKREKTHLNPMWTLVGSRKESLVLSASTNFKIQLQQRLGGKGIRFDYRESMPTTKDQHSGLPLYTIGVYLDGWGAKGLLLGHGTAKAKKDAGMKAAEMAVENKTLLAPYMERKRLFDAQKALERQELEAAQASKK